MLLLALDTTANSVSTALVNEQGVLISRFAEMVRGQGEALMPMMADMMAASGYALSDVTDVAVSVGPGSFTGVRVGLAAAKGIGLALGIPVHGVTTFEVAAWQVKRPVTVVLDTKRGDFYTQFFESEDVFEAPQIKSLAEVQVLTGPLAGDGVALADMTAQDVSRTTVPAEAVGQIACRRLNRPLPAEPVYLRDADVTV